jgi:hypothetical protein
MYVSPTARHPPETSLYAHAFQQTTEPATGLSWEGRAPCDDPGPERAYGPAISGCRVATRYKPEWKTSGSPSKAS